MPTLSGGSVVGGWLEDRRSALTLMAGSQIWPLPLIVATGWKRGSIQIPPWVTPALLHRDAPRGAVEIVSVTDGRELAASLVSPGIVVPTTATQSLVVLRVTSLAQLARAIGAGEDRPVLGMEIEFPALPDSLIVPIERSREPQTRRSIQVFAQGFVELGAPHPAFRTDQVLGTSSNGTQSSERYTALWTPSPTAIADAQLTFTPGAPRLTRLAEFWLRSPLHDVFDIGTLLIAFAALSGIATLAVQRIYPLTNTSRRRAILLGFGNLLTSVGTLVVIRKHAEARAIPIPRATLFALFSSLVFTAEVALLAALTTLLQP